MTKHQQIIKTVQYGEEIIPYYRTINGNIILITEKRSESDEDALFILIQSQTPTKNKTV